MNNFKDEFVALMNKYNARFDYIEDRARVFFYTDDGKGVFVLDMNDGSDIIPKVADCVK